MNRRLAALATTALLLAGCGVPAEQTPRELPPSRGLSEPSEPAGPAEPQRSEGTVAQPIYFVRNDKLVAVIRRIHTPATVDDLRQALHAGPTDAEEDADITSVLTGTLTITGIRISGTRATVEVIDNLTDINRTDKILAFGQIVCTLTSRPKVTTVTFLRNGQPLDIPRGDGSLSGQPATAEHYRALIAPA
ncbi:GerMN domain-containing protein [Paractinoplanes hotanensis]|uniref:GerMN domain-containing protein n=1 Tax=Paractinoplanes hotanensis TaxID=2906497 RepID=A0ABT0YG72_9ACTN|nr:GerMN domain-containing protein [Actinoplanes hotanensis]MCM4085048.1 GerMN domain-containing protein [Actinoplanes hotanensis]